MNERHCVIDIAASIALKRPGDRRIDGTILRDPAVVLEIVGELDLAVLLPIREAVSEAVVSGWPEIIVDAASVEFIDVTALGALIDGAEEARMLNLGFRLHWPSKAVTKLLDLLGLDMSLQPSSSVSASG